MPDSQPKSLFQVQVRELVEFALRRGDLGSERDFVGPRRALAGIRGHQKVQRSRPAAYQKEVPVSYDFPGDEFTLRIQGRIDGVLAAGEEILIEEIKTVQAGWEEKPDPLHWAQARLYAFMYTRGQTCPSVTLRLTYLNLDTHEITELPEQASSEALAAFFHETTSIYLEWLKEHFRWCQERNSSIRALQFPFPAYRPGQRELAVAAYRTITGGRRLFTEAPTGIGKTVSVLFPALKALGEGKLDRIFYLTARTIGRTVAEKAFADMRRSGLQARTLTLTAKEKICPHQGQPCEPLTCLFAKGYYDRRRPAMRAALNQTVLTRSALETIAQEHRVCPFELSLDLSTWVDAVICDYNYVFDPKVYLRRHFGEQPVDYVFLIDEAHNLVDRAREMFSASLDSAQLLEVRRDLKSALPRCARALSKLNSALRKLAAGKEDSAAGSSADDDLLELNLARRPETPAPAQKPRLLPSAASTTGRFYTLRDFPVDLLSPLESVLKEAEAWLARNEPAAFREDLLQLYFELNSFLRTAQLYDERYVTLIESERSIRIRLFCLDPSFLLRQAFERGKAALLFSATLSPLDYYRGVLGGTTEDRVLQLRSPFPQENLLPLVQHRIATRFKDRSSTLHDVVAAISTFVESRRGNYLVYFPSYAYLHAVQEQFQLLRPGIQILVQRTAMTEAEREQFLAAFALANQETLVGFAVLGGIFGEGIDLVGDRLIGVAVVGVGLPQLCLERDLIRDFFQEKTGAGFDYAYTFPGMNRVLQATGRVIRSESDRGTVLLIDTRFAEPRYERLFPAWWQPQHAGSPAEIAKALQAFWAQLPGEAQSPFPKAQPALGSRQLYESEP